MIFLNSNKIILFFLSLLLFSCKENKVKIKCLDNLITNEGNDYYFKKLNLEFSVPNDWYIYSCEQKEDYYYEQLQYLPELKNHNPQAHIAFMRRYNEELKLDEFLIINRFDYKINSFKDSMYFIRNHLRHDSITSSIGGFKLNDFKTNKILINNKVCYYHESKVENPNFGNYKFSNSYLFFDNSYAYTMSIVYTKKSEVDWILKEIKN